MADVTGGPTITNASAFAVPADMTALKDHFGGLNKYSVTTSASLPASSNWNGRQLVAMDTMLTHIWNGSAWVVGNTGGWITATLSAGFSSPANYLPMAYRIKDGFCELRGTTRYTATIPTTAVIIATGLPAAGASDGDAFHIPAATNAGTTVYINPRADGAVRVKSNAVGGAGTDYVHLHGLRYPV